VSSSAEAVAAVAKRAAAVASLTMSAKYGACWPTQFKGCFHLEDIRMDDVQSWQKNGPMKEVQKTRSGRSSQEKK
jgi:hypothetical protein